MHKTLIATALILSPISVLAAESFTIDPAHTFPNFTIDHLGFSTMHGRFGKTEGKITLDRAGKTGSVEVTIDAASIDTGLKKRDDHLRSPDFLNVVEFPTLTYKSTKVTLNDDNSGTVEGNLTIVGVSKPVTLDVKRMNCALHPMDVKKEKFVCGFDAEASIKRSDFGVKYGLPAIGDEMKIYLEVEATRN